MPMKRIGRPSCWAMATTMPPLAVPSSLVSTSPVTPTASLNCARLRERVLPLVGVQHQQHLVRGARVDALDHAPHLLQLLHQVRLAVQAPGGVGDQHVACRAPAPPAGRRTPPRPGRRPAAGRRTRAPDALGPHLELLDGGGAEGVAGGEHHAAALAGAAPRQLADGGGLARAVHADHQDDERPLRAVDDAAAARRARGSR